MRLRNGARRQRALNTATPTQRQCKESDQDHHEPAVALRTRRQIATRASVEERTHVTVDLTMHDSDDEGENSTDTIAVAVGTRRRRKVTMGNDDMENVTRPRKPLQERRLMDETNTIQRSGSGSGSGTTSTRGGDNLKRAASGYCVLLQSAFATEDRIDETNWLTSTLIDLMLWRLASQYPQVHFLATDFCHLHLPSVTRQMIGLRSTRSSSSSTANPHDWYQIRDVLGRSVDYTAKRSLVFVANVSSIHWNLFRIQFEPHAELQLFEPMGRLASRSGISYRSVPRCVIEWLDACYPQAKSWLTRSVSAITRPQQVSGFDCGVACLLYADKCGQGQRRERINDCTSQHEITVFRRELQRQLQTTLQQER